MNNNSAMTCNRNTLNHMSKICLEAWRNKNLTLLSAGIPRFTRFLVRKKCRYPFYNSVQAHTNCNYGSFTHNQGVLVILYLILRKCKPYLVKVFTRWGRGSKLPENLITWFMDGWHQRGNP